MDELRLVGSLFVTGMVGIIIMGLRFMIRDSLSRLYCICGHEFNQHIVYPAGMVNPAGTEKCRVCSCKEFKKNDKDKRNTPPVKFW